MFRLKKDVFDDDEAEDVEKRMSMMRLKRPSFMRLKKPSFMRLKKPSFMRLKKPSFMRLKKPSFMRLRRGPSMMRLRRMTTMRLKRNGGQDEEVLEDEADEECIWVEGRCFTREEVLTTGTGSSATL